MQEKKLFFGKLNSDSGEYALPNNDYLNGRNIDILTPDGMDIGDVKGTKGTTLINNEPLQQQGFRTIGSYSDVGRNRIVYFRVSTTAQPVNNSYIMVYEKDDDALYTALRDDNFKTGEIGFDTDYLIHSVTMEGNMLFWTDGFNPPRKLNLDRAIRKNHIDYVTDLDPYGGYESPQDIELIKKPPVHPPYLDNGGYSTEYSEWGSNTYGWFYKEGYRIQSGSHNLLGNESFLFSTRFIYNDGEISVQSPYTRVLQPPMEKDSSSYGIKVKYSPITAPISSSPFDVKWVELLVKYGNSGVTYIVDRVSAEAYNSAYFNFYNDSLGSALSDEYVAKDFESVPLVSET